MAYDEALAERIRAAVSNEAGVRERKMFGGLAFLLNGNLAVGAYKDGGTVPRSHLLICHPDEEIAASIRSSRCLKLGSSPRATR